MKGSLKLITVSLRDFALPVPRTGDIEVRSAHGRSALEGQEIHLRVQKRRALADPAYRYEVPISTTFERGEYRFRIEGRMDGIYLRTPPRIEEIKSAFDLKGLSRELERDPFLHPYSLQLMSYGFFFLKENGSLPELAFHLVSSRTAKSVELELTLDTERYREWLELRLDELVLEAQRAEKCAARRRNLAASFPFPFEPRPGQPELMREIEEGMAQKRPLFVQAPTGMGKTVGVLYPVLKEALARGQRVVYLTPKNSLHAVAEESVARFKEVGCRIKSLSITAKGKICFHREPLCTPQSCEFARDYYGKLQRHGILEILGKKRRLSARTFKKAGEEFRVCPFELQLDCASQADVVICDYNYVFAPRSAFGRLPMSGVDQVGKPNLIIDEAHNLPARAMEQYSPQLSSQALELLRPRILSLSPRFRRQGEELLDRCLEIVSSCGAKGAAASRRVDPPLEPFRDQDGRLRAFLGRYLEADLDLQPDDPVLRLCFTWSSFVEALERLADPERDEFFATFHPGVCGGTLKITCCDPSAMLKGCYLDYAHVVSFSATLKPFDFYTKLSGVDPAAARCAEFPTPFPKENRKLLIIPQVSTRYSRRVGNYGKIADAIARIASLRNGNYFAFFPSFDFLERVAALFQTPPGFCLTVQERSMRGDRVEAVLDRLRQRGEANLVFGVQGGSFSEGVDYPGEMLIGAFVVGPPLPGYDLEREEMRRYYQRRYGAGFEYAYGIPAMAKAVQSAGRVIRSQTDRGLIVLMDDRFLDPAFTSAMPGDWFRGRAEELVSGSILKEVGDFWK